MSKKVRLHDQQSCPVARKENLSTTIVGDEIVVYNQLTNQASCLDAITAAVWKACNGKNSVHAIQDTLKQSGFQEASEDIVMLALNELSQADLFQDLSPASVNEVIKQSRRDMLRAMGKNAAFAIPVISTISIQPAIAAGSGTTGSPCTDDSQCLFTCNLATNTCT